MYNTSIIDILFLKIAVPVSMIPMVIPKGVIFNVCKTIICNNIIAFKMNFIKEYVSEIEILVSMIPMVIPKGIIFNVC